MNSARHRLRGKISVRLHSTLFAAALLGVGFPAAAESNLVEARCAQTKQYCDQMHAAKSAAEQKILAAKALDSALSAARFLARGTGLELDLCV
jgi:hypothetical protein